MNILRAKSVNERLAGVLDLMAFAWELAETGVRSRYPNANDREVFLRTAALHLSRDEMVRAYQWDPLEHE
ncbi:MAG: hypothetical protein LAP40_21450 [Acidobacteriia bacterium]|nr:hypothetical protein [Terriglobia bacterium]